MSSSSGDLPSVENASAKNSLTGGRDLATLRHDIEHAAHLLPAQGPISVFIHHNTLHAFEELNFDEAVVKGHEVFGCEPYLPESAYARELARGRILNADLIAVVSDDLGERGGAKVMFETRRDFRVALLRFPLYTAPAAELRWYLAESRALSRYRADAPSQLRERFIQETRHWAVRDGRKLLTTGASSGQRAQTAELLHDLVARLDQNEIDQWDDHAWEAFGLTVLWRICRRGAQGLSTGRPARRSERHRDWLFETTDEDADRVVHELLIRFTSAYLDQGLAAWPLPGREQGFFQAFLTLYSGAAGSVASWRRGLRGELKRIQAASLSPIESIAESLELLGVASSEQAEFIAETLLALRGFGGMIWQIEARGDRVPQPLPADSLVEFLAVRLILDRLALRFIADRHGLATEPLDQLRKALRGRRSSSVANQEQLSFQIFHAAQVLGWLPSDLVSLRKDDWRRIGDEFVAFSELERRRLFHAAYERRHRIATLDALAVCPPPAPSTTRPRFQAICCLDEREESFRRHLEEVAPDIATFGAAGFFGVAMYYKGAADAHYTPLCPAVMQPSHWVEEQGRDEVVARNDRRAGARRLLGRIVHRLHLSSRTFSLGAMLSATVGIVAGIPLVARVLFPRGTSRIRRTAAHWLDSDETRLLIERVATQPSPSAEGIGFSLDEMAALTERLLRDIGLTDQFARFVFVIGHGSTSLNNPHESAHDCGACGGGRGGPNARAIAMMFNDPRVRQMLAARGLTIPDDTCFVGAMHNTCDDSLTYFDLSGVAAAYRAEMMECRDLLAVACERNAHERSRRFESAALWQTPATALRHVEARSQDIAEVRPEYGHATNAVCVVGRRGRTRNLFMDRRAFLVSYDPLQDPDGAPILSRILAAVVPVCGGISLEYYFSFVDSPGWGCGTKLPHNITSLVGVMDGAASDLRTGLPWQMVEVHEPVRLLIVIETTPEILLGIIERNPTVARMCRNRWVQLVALSPDSNRMRVFDGERFVAYAPESTSLPVARSSIDWYRGWRDHLGYAVIDPTAKDNDDETLECREFAPKLREQGAIQRSLGDLAAAETETIATSDMPTVRDLGRGEQDGHELPTTLPTAKRQSER